MVSHRRINFSGNAHCGSRDILVLVCQVILENHLTLEDHMIKGSSRFIARSLLK